ncbi:MAG: hypothetical protein ACRDS1_04840 [Pseudonocardiaceae bacterium]
MISGLAVFHLAPEATLPGGVRWVTVAGLRVRDPQFPTTTPEPASG